MDEYVESVNGDFFSKLSQLNQICTSIPQTQDTMDAVDEIV